jgi:hypothetical protein
MSIVGIILLIYQTRFGLSTTGDSVHYLMGAQNLLAGNGYSRWSGGGEIRPITMFPPAYSAVLASMGWMNLSTLDSARILNIALFGANIFLIGFLVYRYTRSIWASGIASGFFLTTSDIVMSHSSVLTEALFITLMLLMIYFLVHYMDTNNPLELVLAGILIAVATLTRYVGLSLLTAGLAVIAIMSNGKWGRRLLDGFVLSAISLAPVFLWLRRNAAVGGTLVNREFAFHPIQVDLIRSYRAEISFWFVPRQLKVPHSVRRAFMLLLGIPAPALFFLLDIRDHFMKKPRQREPFWTLPWFLVFFVISYFLILFFNLTLLDALTDFNTVSRYMVPIYIAAIMLFPIVFLRLLQKIKGWAPRIAVSAVAFFLMAVNAQSTVQHLMDPIPALGYTGIRQERPDVVEMLDSIDRSVSIISNDPEMVFILVNRPAYMIPIEIDAHTGMARDDFSAQLEATRGKLSQGSWLVLFSPMTDAELEVARLLDATMMDAFKGALFYGYPEAIDE